MVSRGHIVLFINKMKTVISTHFKTEELARKEATALNKKRGKKIYIVLGEKRVVSYTHQPTYMKNLLLTQEKLKQLLDYDSDTGIFRWRVRKAQCVKIGTLAGYKSKKGYRLIGVDGKYHYTHRLAWLYVYGEFPKNEIDHINHITDDNRISNLRSVTHSENGRNQSVQKNNTSGIMGVHKWKKKWVAKIQVDGKYKHLGYFENIKDAKKARERAKIRYGYHPNHA